MQSKYTPKDYRYAKLYRTLSYPHYEIDDPFDKMDQDSKNRWVEIYLSGNCESGYEDAMKRVHKIESEERRLEKNEKNEEKVETKTNQYTFVAAKDDVDYDRILREAPKGSQFIIVENRTRTNQAVSWSLFVHQIVLSNPKVSGISLGDNGTYAELKALGPNWGHNDICGTELYSYRVISGPGSVPGYVRKTIDHIKRALNPKDTRVVVSIF